MSDPSSSPQTSRPAEDAAQQGDHHSSDRKGGGSAQAQQEAVAAAAAAARSKAAKAAGSNGSTAGGGGGGPHVKCFFAGVRWGTLLPPGALKDRASLVAAVSGRPRGLAPHCF